MRQCKKNIRTYTINNDFVIAIIYTRRNGYMAKPTWQPWRRHLLSHLVLPDPARATPGAGVAVRVDDKDVHRRVGVGEHHPRADALPAAPHGDPQVDRVPHPVGRGLHRPGGGGGGERVVVLHERHRDQLGEEEGGGATEQVHLGRRRKKGKSAAAAQLGLQGENYMYLLQ